MRTESRLSVYESIVERIKRDISLGIIAEGERLPSCREMALTLGINPNTVQRAYSALEEQGIIYTIPKKGVYAAAAGERGDVGDEAKRQLLALKRSGVTRAELEAIIDEIYGEGEK